jgi:single-strand DNA-binding protein
MTDINSVVQVGRLTRDAELRTGAVAVLKFSIAVNRRKKQDDEWIDEPNFFDCVSFGRSAESVAQYLVKGKQVAVGGELVQNRWTTQDGQNRSKVEILAESIQLLGSKGESGQSAPSQSFASRDEEEEIPF